MIKADKGNWTVVNMPEHKEHVIEMPQQKMYEKITVKRKKNPTRKTEMKL